MHSQCEHLISGKTKPRYLFAVQIGTFFRKLHHDWIISVQIRCHIGEQLVIIMLLHTQIQSCFSQVFVRFILLEAKQLVTLQGRTMGLSFLFVKSAWHSSKLSLRMKPMNLQIGFQFPGKWTLLFQEQFLGVLCEEEFFPSSKPINA